MNYQKLKQAETLKWLEKEKAALPDFCNRFLLSVAQTTTPRTQVAYAQDLRLFCQFLANNVRELRGI